MESNYWRIILTFSPSVLQAVGREVIREAIMGKVVGEQTVGVAVGRHVSSRVGHGGSVMGQAVGGGGDRK